MSSCLHESTTGLCQLLSNQGPPAHSTSKRAKLQPPKCGDGRVRQEGSSHGLRTQAGGFLRLQGAQNQRAMTHGVQCTPHTVPGGWGGTQVVIQVSSDQVAFRAAAGAILRTPQRDTETHSGQRDSAGQNLKACPCGDNNVK